MAIDGAKKSRGRPPADTEPVNVRMPRDLLADLDTFIAEEPDPKPTRPDAIRRLLSDALVACGIRRPS
jgi:hypothetical protein